MGRRISYEWDIETVTADEHEDILDHDHRDRVHEFAGEKLTLAVNEDGDQPGTFYRLCLVRDVYDVEGDGSAHADLVDRSHAYVKDGALETRFSNGVDVPKRFHEEFNR